MVAGGPDDESEEDIDMTLKELLAALRGATPEKRTELLTEHKATLDEYELDKAASDASSQDRRRPRRHHAADPVADPVAVDPPAPVVDPAADPVLVGATESFARNSIVGGMLIRAAASQPQHRRPAPRVDRHSTAGEVYRGPVDEHDEGIRRHAS